MHRIKIYLRNLLGYNIELKNDLLDDSVSADEKAVELGDKAENAVLYLKHYLLELRRSAFKDYVENAGTTSVETLNKLQAVEAMLASAKTDIAFGRLAKERISNNLDGELND